MNEQCMPDRWKWSTDDFPMMGWHDCWIHGIAFFPDEFEFALDIDYIVKWEKPVTVGGCYRFWIAPATMVFKNVRDVKIGVDTAWGMQIADLARTDPQPPRNAGCVGEPTEWTWSLDCQEGSISLRSIGFDMYIRSSTVLLDTQEIPMSARGGISFARPTDVPNR